MATTTAHLEAQLEAFRPGLTGHCYRMLGSVVDADDATQETIIRAWKSLDRFDGRASLKNWLYRIATNVCLDEIHDRGRRAQPIGEGAPSPGDPPLASLEKRSSEYWIEPIPDAVVIPADADPAERAILRQSIRLAFIAALQNLPPKQRAVLILTEVLGWSAAEVAETIDSSVASVNSALQRARATLAARPPIEPAELTPADQRLLDQYVAAFERYDVDALTALLRHDATFSMPPFTLWLQGPAPVRTWLLGHGAGCRGSRLIPTAACGQPAFGQYHPDPASGRKPWALVVLNIADGQITDYVSFLDTATLFPRFGLPLHLPPEA